MQLQTAIILRLRTWNYGLHRHFGVEIPTTVYEYCPEWTCLAHRARPKASRTRGTDYWVYWLVLPQREIMFWHFHIPRWRISHAPLSCERTTGYVKVSSRFTVNSLWFTCEVWNVKFHTRTLNIFTTNGLCILYLVVTSANHMVEIGTFVLHVVSVTKWEGGIF